jgi:hypothetical protein
MSEETHSAIDSSHASPNRTLIMHVPKLQARPALGIEDKQKPQPAWIPMKTCMQKYCEPYFTAVERWRNSRDEQIMINRLTLLDIADQILSDYSQLTTTYFFELVFENKNVDLLEEVQPSAGKFYFFNGDVTAFTNSKSLVPADMFNRIGLFFQSNLLRNISGRNEGYLLSSNLETRKNVISVIENIFRLPEEAGLVHFVYAEGSPHNWRTLERSPMSSNAENFVSFMLDKRDDAKQSAMDTGNNEGKHDESRNHNKNKKTASKSSKASSSSSPTKRAVRQEKIPAVVHLLQKKQQGNGEGSRQSQQKGRIVSSDSEEEHEEEGEEEQEEVIFEKKKNTKGTKAGTTTAVSGDIWKHFFLHSPEGSGSSKIQFAECNHCGIHIRYSSRTGTIPFHTHIEVCPDFDPCRPPVASAATKKRKSTDLSSLPTRVYMKKDKNGNMVEVVRKCLATQANRKHSPVPEASKTNNTTTSTSTSSTSRQAANASNKATPTTSTTPAKKTPATTAAVKKALELAAREKKKFMGTKVAKYLLITFHHSNSSLLKKQAAGLPYSDVQNKELKLFMGEVVDVIPATSQYAKDRKYVIHWLDCNEENEIMDEKDYQDGVDLYKSHFLWTTNHKCMGTKVAAYFFIPGIFTREGEETADGAEKLFIGKVTKYCPSSGARAKDQLYHINWADGDEQDMDEPEFVKGKELYNLLHPGEAEGNTGKGEEGAVAPGSDTKKNTKMKEEKENQNNSPSTSSSALKKKRTIDEVVKEEEENNSYSSDEGEEKVNSKKAKEEKEEGEIQVKKEPRLEDNNDKKVDESEAMEVENQPLEQSEANSEQKTLGIIPVKKEKKQNKKMEEDEEAEDDNNEKEQENEEEEDPFASPAWTTDHISIHTKVTKVLRAASSPPPAPKRGKSKPNTNGGIMKPHFFTHAAYAHGVVLKYNPETKEYWVIWERLRSQEILSEQEYKDGVELSNELLLKEMQSSGKWVLRSLECDDDNTNDRKTTTTTNSKNNKNSNNKNNQVVKTGATKQEAPKVTSALPVPVPVTSTANEISTTTNNNNNKNENENENDSSALTIRFIRSPQPTTSAALETVAPSTVVNEEKMLEGELEEVVMVAESPEKQPETEAPPTATTITHPREAVPTEIVSPTTDVAHSLLNLATSSAVDNQPGCSSSLGEEDLVLPEPDMTSCTYSAVVKEVVEVAVKEENEESTEQTDMETQSQSFNVPVVTTVVTMDISPPERPEQGEEQVMIEINTNGPQQQPPQPLEIEQRAERISEVVPSLPPPRARPAAALAMSFSQQSTTSSHSSNVLSPMKERLLKAEEIETIIYINDDSDEDDNNNNNGGKKEKEQEMEIIEEEEPGAAK